MISRSKTHNPWRLPLASATIAIAASLAACSSGTETDADGADPAVEASEDVAAVEATPLVAPETPAEAVPTEFEALFEYLSAGTYRNFVTSESVTHPSAGPHPGYGRPVRVYMNYEMASSLEAGNEEHPMGASIVKEMFEPDGTTLSGWAVLVKTQEETDAGNGYFWYEVTSPTDSSAIMGDAGNGQQLCVGCHVTGNDYVLSEYPLR